MKKLVFITELFFASAFFLYFSPKNAFAGCDCVDTTWQSGDFCSSDSDCSAYCSVHCAATPYGSNLVYTQEANCIGPTCKHISCNCDTCSEAQDRCSSGGGGFDEGPPECADTPLDFYKYGKEVTSLIANPSFEEHGPEKSRQSCNGCRSWGCPDDPQTSWWRIDGYGWNAEDDSGARNDCPYSNDGPTDLNQCDPPEAQCYNQCTPKLGSWQLATRAGANCEWATSEWCCRNTDEREGWSVEQLVTGLNPSSDYLFLVRSRGKGKGYGGGTSTGCPGDDACWGEGWAEARWQSVKPDSIKAGDFIRFGVGGSNQPWGDETYFDPTITFTNTAGVTTIYRPWEVSDEDFSTQGPIWYYQAGTGVGGGGVPLTYNSSNRIWEGPNGTSPWKRPHLSKERMYPGWYDTNNPSIWLNWKAPEDGIAILSGTVTALGDPCDSECRIDAKIYLNGDKIMDKRLDHEGDSAGFNIVEELLDYGAIDTDYYGSYCDDCWVTSIPPSVTVTTESGLAFLKVKSEHDTCGDCGDWAPRGQADWLELIELCDTPGSCNHGEADGIVWNVQVEKGGRSEMQLSNDAGATWGMIANDAGNIVDNGWAPYSPLFFWKAGSAAETIVRFWNQRDDDQKVVECQGAEPPQPGLDCNESCDVADDQCVSGLTCSAASGSVCRDPDCESRNDCACSPTCSFTSSPSGCIEVGTALSFAATASDPDGAGEGLNYTELWRSPSSESWNRLNGDESCGSAASCNITRSWTPSGAGNYFIACNAYDVDSAQCTGNPWCDWPPCVTGSDCHACAGWNDCGANDYVEITVQDSCAPPPPPPSPPCPPFFCKSYHTWEEIE